MSSIKQSFSASQPGSGKECECCPKYGDIANALLTISQVRPQTKASIILGYIQGIIALVFLAIMLAWFTGEYLAPDSRTRMDSHVTYR